MHPQAPTSSGPVHDPGSPAGQAYEPAPTAAYGQIHGPAVDPGRGPLPGHPYDPAHQPTSGGPYDPGHPHEPGLGGPYDAGHPHDPGLGAPYDPGHAGLIPPPYDPRSTQPAYDPGATPLAYDPAYGGPVQPHDPTPAGGLYDPAHGPAPAPYDPTHGGGPTPAYDPTTGGPTPAYDPTTGGPAPAYDPTTGGRPAPPYDPTNTGGPAQPYDPAQAGAQAYTAAQAGAQAYDPAYPGGPAPAYDATQAGPYDPAQTGAQAYDPAQAGSAYDPAQAGAQPYDPAHAAAQAQAYGPAPGAIPQQWNPQHAYGPPPQASGPPQASAPPATQRPEGPTPTADDFARRRSTRPSDPVATMGMRGVITKGTLGLVTLAPGRHEQEYRHDVEMVRRNFGGLRQVTVVNPKGGAGKTVAVLLLAMTFGQKRGGYVLAWDNNETQGTLGMRALQDFHTRTVRDLLRDLDHFRGAQGRVGDLSQYVRAQGEGMFDVLASDESATAGEMLNAHSFGEIREVVSRFYKLIMVDTGNNVRAQNWQAAIDATDQLVVTMSGRNDSAETAARMLDHLEQQGRHRLVRQAVTVVSMPPSRRDLDIPAISRHFAARTRTVLLAPYERFIDSGEPIRYPQLSSATRNAWLKIASSVAEGL